MSRPTVEFWFDFGSPAAYLAYKRLPDLVKLTGATVTYRPMLLGGVFQATGNRSPVAVPAKGRYFAIDMGRFAQRHAITLTMPPGFPINTLKLMRGAAALLDRPEFQAYADSVYTAMFSEGQNLADGAVVNDVVARAGLDPAEFTALIEDQAVKDRLKAMTEEAVAKGIFGAPTFFVGDEMFFGQDRMDFVANALLSG